MLRHPLLLIAVAFAAGIASAPRFHLRATEQMILLTLCFVAGVVLHRMDRLLAGQSFVLLAFFLCGTFLAAADKEWLPPNHLEHLARDGAVETGQPLEITGWARTSSTARPGRETFDLEITAVVQDGTTHPARGGIRVYYYLDPELPASLAIPYGARLRLKLRNLRRPRNFGNPGSYDYVSAMHRDRIHFTAILREPADRAVLPGRAGTWWRSAVYGLRTRFLRNLDTLLADSPAPLAVLKAMLLGDDNWLTPRTETAFQKSGTYHVLVISGWNVAALAIPLLWLLGRLRIPAGLASVVVMAAVIIFTFLAEADIPVARAALMFLLYLLARHLYRDRALLNSIAAAALILLILHPSDLWDWGFQLSFLAVLVLVGVSLPLVEWWITPFRAAAKSVDDAEQDSRFSPRQVQFRGDLRVLLDRVISPAPSPTPSPAHPPARAESRQDPDPDPDHSPGRHAGPHPVRWRRAALSRAVHGGLQVAEAALFTAVIQIGFALVTALYFHRVTWSGFFANLLILPLASLIVLLGMAVLLVSLLWWPAAEAGAVLLGWLAAALEGIAEWSAGFAYLNARVPAPPGWLSIVFLCLLLAAAFAVARRSRWVWAPALGLLAVCLLLTAPPWQPDLVKDEPEVTVLDVGQGDSIFVAFPNGETMLVDGGGDIPFPGATPRRQFVGESVVSSYLWTRGIQRLDYVVLSHDHWDHFGGLQAVFDNFEVGEFWIGPDPADRDMEWLRERARGSGAKVIHTTSDIIREVGGVEVGVLSPAPDWAPRRVSNDDSIVLRLTMGRRSILLPGDIERRIERLLAEGPPAQGSVQSPLQSDVLKVPHHGSRTSSTPEFLRRVRPAFGIISVGAFGRFGHPHEQVLAALRENNIRIYRTDRDGAVGVRTDGNRLRITAYRDSLRPWPRFYY